MNKRLSRLLRQTALSLLLLGGLHSAANAEALPDDSLYQFDSEWKTSADQPFHLNALAGKKQVVSFIYTDCNAACPVIVANLKELQAALTPEQQAKLGFVLISLDPEHDSPKELAHFAHHHELDNHWLLLSGKDAQVRELAMAMNIQYKKQANGEIAHSNTFSVLDEQGRLQFQQAGLKDGAKVLAERIFSVK